MPTNKSSKTQKKKAKVTKTKKKVVATTKKHTAVKSSKKKAVKKAVKKVVKKTAKKVVKKVVKKVRSFKVQLPDSETYEGRFTGLTPYQAANKALSKYYRENGNKSKGQILFSIKESTRGSKRSTYTYNGKREKLVKPVEYSIENGKIIVKNYKNKLTKIKKAELANMNLSL